jgi:hypothetical protein
MKKESFLIFKAFYEPIKELSNEDLGQLFRSIFEYQINDIEPPNTSRIYMAFLFFKNQFRLDEIKYNAKVEVNKNNGSKGGRPKKTEISEDNQNNPMGFSEPKKADNDKDNVNDKDINSVFSFSEFWSLYPHKVAKQRCETKYKNIPEKEREQIKLTLSKFLSYKPFPLYTHPNPEAYLNQKRWEDVIPETINQPEQREETEREYRQRTWLERNGGNL